MIKKPHSLRLFSQVVLLILALPLAGVDAEEPSFAPSKPIAHHLQRLTASEKAKFGGYESMYTIGLNEKILHSFLKADRNQDDVLTLGETLPNAVFKKVDTNEDAQVSYDEYVQGYLLNRRKGNPTDKKLVISSATPGFKGWYRHYRERHNQKPSSTKKQAPPSSSDKQSNANIPKFRCIDHRLSMLSEEEKPSFDGEENTAVLEFNRRYVSEFVVLDRNHDRQISPVEHPRAEKMDQNNDGTVSYEEYGRYRLQRDPIVRKKYSKAHGLNKLIIESSDPEFVSWYEHHKKTILK